MSNLSALDMLIAASVASYTVSEDKAPKAPKAPKVKAPKVERIPSDNAASGKAMVQSSPKMVGTPGTLDATAFVLAMRNAGKRPNDKGVMISDPSKVKGDEVQAIGDFIGYDVRLPHGENLFRANMAAKRSPSDNAGPSRSEVRRAQASIVGFVAGVPDNAARHLQNLQARERLAVEAIIGFQKEATSAKTAEERAMAEAKLALEQGRLSSIREDLDRLA